MAGKFPPAGAGKSKPKMKTKPKPMERMAPKPKPKMPSMGAPDAGALDLGMMPSQKPGMRLPQWSAGASATPPPPPGAPMVGGGQAAKKKPAKKKVGSGQGLPMKKNSKTGARQAHD